MSAAIDTQLQVCGALLQGLGLAAERVRALAHRQELVAAFSATAPSTVTRAPFETFDEKRNTILQAVDRLADASSPVGEAVPLPPQALFGEAVVDSDGCTLCLACASACPGSALLGGTDSPVLRFIESKCVQCGLCVTTCPEQVITLTPRLLLDPQARRSARTLCEQPPFLCLECGKPFATQKVIETMQRKLQDHWMFSDERALRRLKLCDECRVKDLFNAPGGLGVVDKH